MSSQNETNDLLISPPESPAAPILVTPTEAPLTTASRLLSSGRDAAVYSGLNASNGEPVELVHLQQDAVSNQRRQLIETRLRLVQLLAHPAHRNQLNISDFTSSSHRTFECCATKPLSELLTNPNPQLDEAVLLAIQSIGSVLTSAHSIGLGHGALLADAIRLRDDLTVQLDFTRLDDGLRSDPNYPIPFDQLGDHSSDQAIQDARDFATIIEQMLRRPSFVNHSSEVHCDPRQMASLKQLVSRAFEPDSRLTPLMIEFDEVLAYLYQPHRYDSRPEVVLNNSTSELQPHAEKCVQDSTSQLKLSTDQTDSTAAIDFSSSSSLRANDASEESPISNGTSCIISSGDSGSLEPTNGNPQSSFKQLPKETRSPGDIVGRYKLLDLLGQGAMGSVFKAIDVASNQTVAIKFPHDESFSSSAVRRFRKETRLLARINNDYVTRLLDANEDQGHPYLVLEYVEGIELRTYLNQVNALSEHQALHIASCICRALLDAHPQGIVHRDIKPDNILLATLDHDLDWKTSADAFWEFKVKLADFGIARSVDQSESLAMTQAGVMLGTPRYISPEQCKGKGDVTPAADVYSLGITLFELLTGQTPFEAPDAIKMIAKHCFETPPRIRSINPKLSPEIENLVARMIAKEPSDRFDDAAELLEDIESMQTGEAIRLRTEPQLPVHDESKIVEGEYSWDLQSSPEDLWPLVTNTDRVNHALGLPSVRYETVLDPHVGVRRFGNVKLAGMSLRWEESPFEWVNGKRLGILRLFDNGPFVWFSNCIQLEPLATGGCRLTQHMKIMPRNWVGRGLAKMEVQNKARKNLAKVYSRIDQNLAASKSGATYADPFEPSPKLSTANSNRLEERLVQLTSDGVSVELSEAFGSYLRTASAQDLHRIRPMLLADTLGYPSNDVIECCIKAASLGILELQWDLLCPICRSPADRKAALNSIGEHSYCEACDLNLKTDAAEAVELVFQIHPDIRTSDSKRYCFGGPTNAPHVEAQIQVAQDERLAVEVKLECGDYLIRGPRHLETTELHVTSNGAPKKLELNLSDSEISPKSGILKAGNQQLLVVNESSRPMTLRIERTIDRNDVVTAAHAATMGVFRERFPSQLLQTGQLLSAKQLTLMMIGINDVESIYRDLGEVEAFSAIQTAFDACATLAKKHRGVLVKSLGESVLLSFERVEDAVQCAIQLKDGSTALGSLQHAAFSCGLHRGQVLVTTLNDRLDYAGAAARTVRALLDFATGNLILTSTVYEDPGITRLLQSHKLAGEIRQLALPSEPQALIQQICIP